MPLYETRKIRDLAAALMLLAGVLHVAQLWIYQLSADTLIAAVLGMFYFLIALGLAGRSRFTLWIGVMVPAIGTWADIERYLSADPVNLVLVNVAINLMVIVVCGYTLIRTRHSQMD